MFSTLSKYIFEIVIGLVIFVAIIYFLPGNNIQIPDIQGLKLDSIELAFVVDENTVSGSILDISDPLASPLSGTLQEATTTGAMDTIEQFIEETITTGETLTIDQTTVLPIQEPAPLVYQSCVTPWGNRIVHGDSVIAYQQRTDDPGTCNIQRRVCHDGVLQGTFVQSSCKEYFGYNPQKQEVVAYNIPSSDPYIQPQPLQTIQNVARNNASQNMPGGSSIGNNSRIIPLVDDYSFATSRVPAQGVTPFVDGSSDISSSSYVWDGTTCTTPRGSQVKNGQFIKAYKLDKGFSNLPCEVELRYCVQTRLEGSFAYNSCQHYDIAVQDYLLGHEDPNEPSVLHLIETLHGSADRAPSSNLSLWQKFESFIKNIFS